MGYTLITPENKKPEENMLITQANKLVEAKYTLSLYEQRLILIMISMIEPEDEDFKDYIIKVSDFSDLIGLKSRNLYPTIKKLLVKLRERTLVIEKGKDYLITGWISSAEYVSSEGIVKLSFDSKLKPFLLQLKREFTKQKLGQAIKFKGVYTIRIYGLLKQYEKLGTRGFSVDEFRKVLGIADGKLSFFADLKKRTITQAQKEFSRKDENGAYFSDINFILETIKTGRKVTGLIFNIFKQNARPAFAPVIALAPQEKNEPVIKEFTQMIDLGIAKIKANKYLEQYGVKYLSKKIELLLSDMELGLVKNPAGYLTKAIIEDWTDKKSAERKRQEEERKKKEKEQFEKYRKRLLEEKIKELASEFKKKEISDFLSTKSDEELIELLHEIKSKNSFGSLINDLSSPMATSDIVKKIPCFIENQEAYIKKFTPVDY